MWTALLCALSPSLKSLRQDPTGQGAETIQKLTFYATFVVALVSGLLQARQSLAASLVRTPAALALNAVTYTAGALALYQISNFITERGLGDGFSVIISLGILSGYSTVLKKFLSATLAGGMRWPILAAVALASLSALAFAHVLSETSVNVPVTVHSDGGAYSFDGGGGAPAPGAPGAAAPRLTDAETVRVQSNPSSTGPLLMSSIALEYLSAFLALQGIDALRMGTAARYLLTAVLVVTFNVVGYAEVSYRLNAFFASTGSGVRGLRPGLETVAFLNYLSLTLRCAGGAALACLAVAGDALDCWLVDAMGAERVGLSSMLIIVGVITKIRRQVLSLMEVPRLRRSIQGGL